MSTQKKVTVEFEVNCGHFRPGGMLKQLKFAYQVPAPAGLQITTRGIQGDEEAVTKFTRAIATFYHRDILNYHPWTCVGCDRPAKDIVHTLISMLYDSGENPDPDYVPAVADNAVPVCISGGDCHRKAIEALQTCLKFCVGKALPNHKMALVTNFCNRCGKQSEDNMLCGGCKIYRYCSKKCQKEDWPSHKERCRNAQAEQAVKKL